MQFYSNTRKLWLCTVRAHHTRIVSFSVSASKLCARSSLPARSLNRARSYICVRKPTNRRSILIGCVVSNRNVSTRRRRDGFGGRWWNDKRQQYCKLNIILSLFLWLDTWTTVRQTHPTLARERYANVNAINRVLAMALAGSYSQFVTCAIFLFNLYRVS